MANFIKRTEMTADFSKNDVHYVSVSLSNYNNSIQIATRADETVFIKFADKDDLQQFVNLLINTVFKTKWTEDYSSQTTYTNEKDIVTMDRIDAVDVQSSD